MTKEELINVKGGISFGIFNVISGLGKFILKIAVRAIYPVKVRM